MLIPNLKSDFSNITYIKLERIQTGRDNLQICEDV